MAINKPSKKTMSISHLVVAFAVNLRLERNYDIANMKEQIVAIGRIIKPIIVESKDGTLTVLQGNRRTLAGQELLADEKCPADLKAALEKVDVIVYEGLTETEREDLIQDHGSEKPLCRTEIVQAIWRLDKLFFSEGQIIMKMYFALAKYTGNERKLSEVPAEGKAREAFLRKWLHGTVGNFILGSAKMGHYVRDQMVLTHLAEDKLLNADEKVEMRCTRQRIGELSTAKSADLKSDKGWTPESGGETFNALIEKFKGEDAGTIETEKKARPTVKELTDKSDVFKSSAVRKALLVAAGETGDKVAGLLEDDDRIYRDEQAMKKLAAAWDNLPEPLKSFAKHLLDDSPKKLEEYLATLKA